MELLENKFGQPKYFSCARHQQARLARLAFERQEGSAADVNICSLTLFSPLFPPSKLFMNSAGVKGHEVIHSNSQLDAVSKVRLFLSANELRPGRGQQLSGN